MTALLLFIIGYFVGAIPTGLIVGKWCAGIDLREHGSRNIGFTNAVRVLGWKLGVPVLVVDVAKAWAATALVPIFVGAPALAWLAGLGVLAGNLFNAFLGFKGGKGVATGLGVFLALTPAAVLAALASFLVMLAVTRIVSIGSIAAAVVLPVVALLTQGVTAGLALAVVASALVIWKHRENIRRLRAGTETRLGQRQASAG